MSERINDYEEFICCICGKEIIGWGNNPTPIKEEGRCCDSCNFKDVIPERLRRYNP